MARKGLGFYSFGMPVDVRSNPYHPTRDILLLKEPWTPQEVLELAREHPRPLSQKAVPGTSKHQRLLAAGAEAYQQCPPLEFDASTRTVKQWCVDHRVLPVVSLKGMDVAQVWTDWYEVVHRGWSPTAAHDELVELFTDLVDEIDPARSCACLVQGELVAVAFCFSGDTPPEILTEAVLPGHPNARDAVASCMATVLSGFDQVVRFDGHVSDPHFAPLWSSVPGVYAGQDDPLDLLEIRPGH